MAERCHLERFLEESKILPHPHSLDEGSGMLAHRVVKIMGVPTCYLLRDVSGDPFFITGLGGQLI